MKKPNYVAVCFTKKDGSTRTEFIKIDPKTSRVHARLEYHLKNRDTVNSSMWREIK